MTLLRLATRSSALARWQAEHVAELLRSAHPGVQIEMVALSTEGDRRLDVALSELGGKGVFVTEVQAALLDGRADLAVHSAKDLPAVTPDGLAIAAVPPRGDPRDALVGLPLDRIAQGGCIATGSQRRAVQLQALRPDLEIVGLRGNIETRVARAAEHDAVVVALAALVRLGREADVAQVFEVDEMIPQVGQGSLAVECRADDAELLRVLAGIDDAPSRRRLVAERAFLAELGGDCDLPAGAYAELVDGAAGPGLSVRLRALLSDADGLRSTEQVGDDPVVVGVAVAQALVGR